MSAGVRYDGRVSGERAAAEADRELHRLSDHGIAGGVLQHHDDVGADDGIRGKGAKRVWRVDVADARFRWRPGRVLAGGVEDKNESDGLQLCILHSASRKAL